MPRCKGLPKTGGRAKGTPNRRTQNIMEKLEALGCDPIAGLAHIAMNKKQKLGVRKGVPVELRAQMYKELAQYVAPKRKAAEIEIQEPRCVQVGDARERLAALINRQVAAMSDGNASGEQSQNDPV